VYGAGTFPLPLRADMTSAHDSERWHRQNETVAKIPLAGVVLGDNQGPHKGSAGSSQSRPVDAPKNVWKSRANRIHQPLIGGHIATLLSHAQRHVQRIVYCALVRDCQVNRII
jgi:hypothetical protein